MSGHHHRFQHNSRSSPDELRQGLIFHLRTTARSYGITLEAPLLELQFEELILALAESAKRPVVILIDEYDKRIIEHLGKGQAHLETAKNIRDVLKPFFGILKGQSIANKLRLVFITGVSRFTKVSLFSDLNNLRDLSMVEAYVDMLGYTQQELEGLFKDEIGELARKVGSTTEQVLKMLARKYNGYRFFNAPVRLYNPFSVLNALNDLEFRD